MIRQSFKLIWNQRRKHLGISLEIFFCFLVLFLVFSFILNYFQKYISPLGFSYENVWIMELNSKGAEKTELLNMQTLIHETLNNYPEVLEVASTGSNVPFGGGQVATDIEKDNAFVNAQTTSASTNYFKTMQMEMVEGTWFDETHQGSQVRAAVITEDLATFLYPDKSAVGKNLTYDDEVKKIVGVCKNFRYRGGFQEHPHTVFTQERSDEFLYALMIRVNDRADAAFEEKMRQDIQQIVPGWTFVIKYMEEERDDMLLLTLVPSLLLAIIGTFLIFNVALGLFGVLWQNINRRKKEIGVRRALGSSKSEITLQFMLEVLVLATISLLVGVFFAVQFPLLDVLGIKAGIYIASIVFAIISIYFLVIVCALIPSSQAAELHPAIALREN